MSSLFWLSSGTCFRRNRRTTAADRQHDRAHRDRGLRRKLWYRRHGYLWLTGGEEKPRKDLTGPDQPDQQACNRQLECQPQEHSRLSQQVRRAGAGGQHLQALLEAEHGDLSRRQAENAGHRVGIGCTHAQNCKPCQHQHSCKTDQWPCHGEVPVRPPDSQGE